MKVLVAVVVVNVALVAVVVIASKYQQSIEC